MDIFRPIFRPITRPMTRSFAGASYGRAAFSPASNFSTGGPGIWADQSDVPTQFQDTAGSTPVTASGDPVGKTNDKSGRSNHLVQATSAARPIYTLATGIHFHAHDGIDDGPATAAFAAGTLSSDMDCFLALRRGSTTAAILGTTLANDNYFAFYTPGFNGASTNNAGSPTYAVNNVAVPGGNAVTTNQLDAAIPASSWVVLEIKNLNLSAWTSFSLRFTGTSFTGDQAGLILCQAGDATARTNNRRWLGNKVGLSL